MLQEQLEKIKNLVRTSQILDSTERQEWLTLLGIMNDKQLSELERILTSGMAKETPAPRFAPPAVSSSQAPKVSKTPSLKHIMNLPAWQKSGLAPGEAAIAQAGVKKNGFLSKLASVLKEKELPEGHPEFELELSAPGVKADKKLDDSQKFQRVPPAGRPESVKQILEQRPLKKERIVPKVPLPKKFAGSAPSQNIMTQNLNLTLGKGSSALIYSSKGVETLGHKEAKQTAATFGLKEMETAKENIAAKRGEGIAETQQIQPKGRDQSRRVESEAVFSAQKIKDLPFELEDHKGIDKWPKLESVVSRPATGAPQAALHLDTLDKLSDLSIAQFEGDSLEDLVVKIKKLVKSYGYHEVVFNLEKSPLFKAYINTGMQLLNERTSQADQNIIKDNFLSKREFEKFVDLLRQIQAV